MEIARRAEPASKRTGMHLKERLSSLAWYPAAIGALVILLIGLPVALRGDPIGVTQAHLSYEQSSLNSFLRQLTLVTVLISGATSVALAALLHFRRGSSSMRSFLSFYLLGYGVLLAGPIELLQPYWPAAPWVNSFLLLPIFIGPLTSYLFATFPNGHFVPRWSRWLIPLSAIFVPATFFLAPDPGGGQVIPQNPMIVTSLVLLSLIFYAGAIYCQRYRYRYHSNASERRRTKWVLYGLFLWLTTMGLTSIGWFSALSLPQGAPAPWWLALAEFAWVVSTLFLPITLAIAMLRHKLFDINILFNRTLTFGVLTAGVIGLYVLAVAVVGLALQTNRELAAALITLLVATALLRPLRSGLQTVANRWIPLDVPATIPHPAPEESAAAESRTVSQSVRHDNPAAALVGKQRRAGSLGEENAHQMTAIHRRLYRLWPIAAAAALILFLASLPGYALRLTIAPHSGGLEVQSGSLAYGLNSLNALLSIGAAALSLGLALLVYRSRGDDRMALFLSFYLLAHGIIVAGPLEALDPFVPGLANFTVTYLSTSIMGPASIALLAVFPDGRFVPSWTRPVTFASLLFVPIAVLLGDPDLTNPGMVALVAAVYLLFFGTGGAMIYAQIYRHRHVSSQVQRQQTKWFVFGFGLWLGMAAISSIPYIWLASLPPGSPYPSWAPAAAAFWWLATAALPISVTLAITRSRLYEIDLIINRTLVYGALTGCVVAIYALVVGGLGLMFQSSGNVLVSLVATGLVAVLFQPLRERLQRSVNRLTYGARQDPVSVLTSLGQQLEETITPQAALDGIVRTVSTHLKLPFAGIEFEDRGRIRLAASYGQRPAQTLQFPIIYQTERIGRLVVGSRSAQEGLDKTDKLLLENIARQAGATAQAAKLAADLQHSRQQLVAAREEERRRLRRDLHDGLGPQLASQTLTLDALEKRLESDPQAASRLLRTLKKQAQEATRDIRRLVYNLRPPALDELGLVGALAEIPTVERERDLSYQVEADPDLPALPAAVEVAAFRIAQEAVTNVQRHAQARVCRVEIRLGNDQGQQLLRLTVEDDGTGRIPTEGFGVGLLSMRERAEELGGQLSIVGVPGSGTRVTAQLPFPDLPSP